jgi:hypothetical protein
MRTFWPADTLPPGWQRFKREVEAHDAHPALWETLRKLSDFRPSTCERCCQIACEQWVLLLMSLLLPGGGDWRREIATRQQKDHLKHLLEERHVLALLPSASRGVKQG